MAWYRGVDRTGRSIVGSTSEAPMVFVESKYRARWRSLSLKAGDVEIGAIGPHPSTGKRIWWAQQSFDELVS